MGKPYQLSWESPLHAMLKPGNQHSIMLKRHYNWAAQGVQIGCFTQAGTVSAMSNSCDSQWYY